MEELPSPTNPASHAGEDVLTAGQRDPATKNNEFESSQDAAFAKQLLEDYRKQGHRKTTPPPRARPYFSDSRQSFGGNSTGFNTGQHGFPPSPYFPAPAQPFPWQWQVSYLVKEK